MVEHIKGVWGIFYPIGQHQDAQLMNKRLNKGSSGFTGIIIKLPAETYEPAWNKINGGI